MANDNSLLYSFKAFAGINNIDPSFRLPQNIQNENFIGVIADLETIENLDIDNAYSLKTRPGTVKKVTGVDMHSCWSNDSICLFVDGSKLYLLMTDYSITELKDGLVPGASMVYQEVNDRVYMTNGTFIGYYKDMAIHDLQQTTIQFKVALPPGQRITYFQGQLFIAAGKVVYISDALSDHYDIRTGFRAFAGDISMLAAVDKGIYVADGKTWFLTRSPALRLDEPDEFRRELILDADAIPGTDVVFKGNKIKNGTDGNYLAWTSTEGICMGDSSGKILFQSSDKYSLPSYAVGGAFLRDINGVIHYISTLG